MSCRGLKKIIQLGLPELDKLSIIPGYSTDDCLRMLPKLTTSSLSELSLGTIFNNSQALKEVIPLLGVSSRGQKKKLELTSETDGNIPFVNTLSKIETNKETEICLCIVRFN